MISQVLAIAIKDLRLLSRDRGALFFTIIFPVIIAVLFGMVFGRMSTPGALDVVVVVTEEGPLARSFATALQADPALRVEIAENKERAVEIVRRGKAAAAIILPDGFDARAETLFTGGSMPLDLLGDPSRAAELGLLEGKLMEIGFRQFMLAVTDSDRLGRQTTDIKRQLENSKDLSEGERSAITKIFAGTQELSAVRKAEGEKQTKKVDGMSEFRPVRIRTEMIAQNKADPPSTYAVTFPQGIVWGLAGCVMAFVTTLASERAQGTLTRLRAAPLSMHLILASKGLACVVSSMIMQSLILALGWFVFDIRPINLPMLLFAMLVIAISFTALAMMIAALFRSGGGTDGAGRALILVLAIVGGGSIPLVFMPPVLKSISVVSPFRWAIAALEGPLWRGGSISDQFASIGSIAIVGLVCAVISLGGMARWRRGM
ncbi:MAG: ABC transporter permease [Planctomycetota bacterium]|nr:ABC transporter permease [Planctomycetota bacterium]